MTDLEILEELLQATETLNIRIGQTCFNSNNAVPKVDFKKGEGEAGIKDCQRLISAQKRAKERIELCQLEGSY